ncbi:hypothetical protein DFH07DRAFT_302027 [Mycena maculata]|uniref:F-box domain-containing protein n=1 Tax=Mycena maculata TaxID=230809 RepID=A0AAD7HHY8_9AGAR|nr:hypothetical protein DFH07DRAFT_302027 [Mycena maculata]
MAELAQLLDLPTELLLLILSHPDLPSDDLLNLSVLCRRLHHLALPIYFQTHGIEDPTQRADFNILDSGRDPLAALQMALFIPVITELSCSFPHYETSIHPLFPHIHRLRTLIARLVFVRKVTLVLDTPDSFCGATGDGVDTWALEFGELLNTILKRGCTSLTLRYGMFFSQAYKLRPPRLVTRPVHAFRNVVRHMKPENELAIPEGWEALQLDIADTDVVSMEVDPEGCSSSTLTHFKIESSMLLLPPCFSWSLSALRHSPLTCLELYGITLPTKIWSAVLPPVAALVPALADLNLSNLYGISGIDILLFLVKLPWLKRLTIGYTEYSRHIQSACPDSGPIPKLHELTHLHAPSTFISHFLQKKSLPKLESLCITPRKPILGFRGMRHIGRSVSDIVRRLEKHKLTPTLALEIYRARDSDSEMAADLAVAPGEELMRSLRAITRLIVYSDAELTGPELGTLARWIARFPALLHVSLRVRGDGCASLDTARTIAERNPNVESLELNGKLFDAGSSLKRISRENPPFIGR